MGLIGAETQLVTTNLRSPQSAEAAAGASRQLNISLIAWMVAGVQTQYEHLRAALPPLSVQATSLEVIPYLTDGWIERLPLPASFRGTLRSTRTVVSLFGRSDIDAVWTQVALPLLPFAVSRAAWDRIPIFYAIDCTPKQLFGFGRLYPHVTDPISAKGRLSTACLRLFFRHCAAVLPWSEWAARSMIKDYGVPPDRVHVIAPGVDVQRWTPAVKRESDDDRTKILFVGGDFERKGGPLLLDLYRAYWREVAELHLVTRASIAPEPGVVVYQFDAGAPGLLELYRRCSLLVVPTLADCFSMAAIEAMACGLPVITSAVGGIPEIVADRTSGYLVPVGNGTALRAAVETLLAEPDRRRRFGEAGRAIAARRFDAAIQSQRVVDLVQAIVER